MLQKKIILQRLQKLIDDEIPIVGAAIGSGISAKYVKKGGADLIMVLNAGIYRMSGVSSTAALLPFANSNQLVMDIGKTQIIPRVDNIPVIFGVCGTDPTIDQSEFIDKIINAKFSGITNYPSVGIIDGVLKKHLKENNLYYNNEVDLISRAVDKDILTIAFAFNEQQAIQMAQAETDILCINLGWTKGGNDAPNKQLSLDIAIEKIKKIYSSVDKIKSDLITLVYGGPISSPEAANYIFKETNVKGYIGGSTFERIPLEEKIEDTTKQYKSFCSLKKRNKSKMFRQKLRKEKSFGQLVGQSKKMQEIYSIIDQIADKKVNILITGESGTGKELVAKAIHYYGDYKKTPFVPVNAASIPYNLLESELFGHEKGAFTGSYRNKKGKFEIASGGTLFLDEISEMQLGLQAKLLRVIQEEKIQRLGAEQSIDINLRLIAATNKDLTKMIEKNKFREDLYYRLNIIKIKIPPLRERKEDIPLLIDEFIKELNKKYDSGLKGVTSKFLNSIIEHDWPGNVRELKNVVERAFVLNYNNDKYLTYDFLPNSLKNNLNESENTFENTDSKKLKTKLSLFEKDIIKKALAKNNYNQSKTAAELDITRKTLRKKIRRYDLKNNE